MSGNPELDEARVFCEKLMEGAVIVNEVCQIHEMTRFKDCLESKTESMKSSRTATVWLQYMDIMDILSKFVRRERNGN